MVNSQDYAFYVLVLAFGATITLSILRLFKLYNFNAKHKSILVRKFPPVGDDFSWQDTKPLPIRPFVKKKNFNVSMNLSNLVKTPQDWLLIEDTYLKQTQLRKKFTELYPNNTLLSYDNDITTAAVKEFYEIVTNYFLTRYPQYFKYNWYNGMIKNLINDEEFPKYAKNYTPHQLILYLAANIEEDFLILIKDDPNNHDEEYILRASVTGFPAGFDPSHGHNKPISFIHGPVPQYENRLKLSMGKFFNNLQPKDLWVRHNWSVQTHKSYFSLDSNHGRKGEVIKQLSYDEIDFDDACFLRVERQIFTRLPKSRANIMTVRTYLTPMKQIKAEGLGEELSRAIDSLPDDLAFYKKRAAWGEAVKQFLNKEDNFNEKVT
ncbi:hypothetical protein DFJ63DRAFT_63562 [Scheffersomyces coipomensis]|uniref:uncharacterized protein n=1 Tax=Scheffersomyces coipomensis TaxID=1788519 RepID=UPI00315D6A5F